MGKLPFHMLRCDINSFKGQRETMGSNSGGSETRLNKMQLALINSRKCLCQFVEVADRALYQTLLEIIVGDSLRSMPPSLLHTVRIMVKRVQVSASL